MLLIGDPKQEIYASRGADISTYITARSNIQEPYTLNTNWLSAPGIVKSVNMLFQRMNNVFMFREIDFQPVHAASKNSNLRFELHGKTQPTMCFWLMDGEGCSIEDYYVSMAQHCAEKNT